MNNKIHRVVIIGVGRIFKKHYQSIKSLKNKFEIVGVFDRAKEKNIYGCKLTKTNLYDNLDDLLKTTKPDVVSILVESGNHLKVCSNIILKYNIRNFIIEKPLDVSTKKILQFQKFIKNKNVNIFTVKQNRFNKAVKMAKFILGKNLIGSIFMISASCKWRRDQSYYDQDLWRGKRKLDGGVLMNQAIHHIDLLIHLAGDVHSVIGFGDTKFVKMQCENIAVASIKFKNGCLGTLEATTATSPKDYEGSITILGSKGTIKIGGFASNEISYFANESKTLINLNKYKTKINSVYGHGHKKFYEYVDLHLSKKIKSNSFDIKSSIKSVEVVEKIVKSFKSKKIERTTH